MKLTKEQIKFIDDYLIKNKVKFWDVRLELIDHIVLGVEDLMKEGQSFEDAMYVMHKAFGNNPNPGRLNEDNTAWIYDKSLYEHSEGFKNLVENKRNLLHRKYQRMTATFMKQFFKTPQFFIMYFLIIGVVYQYYSLIPYKAVKLTSLIAPIVFYAVIGLRLLLAKIKKSLALTVIGVTMNVTTLLILNFVPYFADFFGTNGSEIGKLIMIVMLILYVLLFFGVNKVFSHVRKEQELYYSKMTMV